MPQRSGSQIVLNIHTISDWSARSVAPARRAAAVAMADLHFIRPLGIITGSESLLVLRAARVKTTSYQALVRDPYL
jgi:hypothetical protein